MKWWQLDESTYRKVFTLARKELEKALKDHHDNDRLISTAIRVAMNKAHREYLEEL